MDNNKCNVERFSGIADHYDKYRPVPPKIITQVLTNYIDEKPALVVDLGCGTGLSTFLWSSVSDKVIGIDPNRDMLNKAIDKWNRDEESNNVVFQFGYGNDTNLESDCADIITCSSSFQWMEPVSTINEILRILRKGGVFAIYSPNQPPTFDWV
jgi:ubiquinone/menaquinone biosynthesis C-methylase UbiE